MLLSWNIPTSPFPMGGAVFLCVSLLFDLRPNYCNENNGELLQKVPCTHCWTQCPWTCSRPPSTHISTGDSWTLSGMSGSVSYGITAPFSWVLVHTRLCALQESVSPVLCEFWWLYGGVNGDLLHEGLYHTEVCCTQSPCPCGRPLLTPASTGDTQTQFWLSLFVHKVLFEPSVHFWWVWGFDSKCDFSPPTIFLGLPLCPWTWGICFRWDPTFSCFMVVQQQVVILEFS